MAHRSARELALAALREWRSAEPSPIPFWRGTCDQAICWAGSRLHDRTVLRDPRAISTLLDFWIESLRPEHLDHDARDLLRLGLYQLFLLETPEHAAVYETVELAGARTRSLVNAVLRNALRRKEELDGEAGQQDLSVRSSHPQFLIDRWTQNFGAENSAALCEWNNRPAPIYARINRLRISTEEFSFEALQCAERLPQRENFVAPR